ncbi:mitochondrial import inner membrane translocase subunit TIM50-like isoform X1 [Cucumis sativus]|uniref:mitochondrial import inner membrane translocase subunit TIM50-like isoform X1 n=1 Tax=Cucumis sativus TaxID=3659 RepID=UPI0012F4F0C0|nr:mitochondrial import inner membrane translocase subunit TIM50-like isoform X1 [Cucumis sativus]
MSPLIFRSRFFSLLKNRHGRLMSSDLASTPSKDALNASQKLVSDQIPPDAQTTSATSSSSSSSKPWNFFKYSLIGALTGATAVAGYASYDFKPKFFLHFPLLSKISSLIGSLPPPSSKSEE